MKISPIYSLYIGNEPIREETCPGPSALWGSVTSSFPRRLYLPSVSTGSPFAAAWTVCKRSNRCATRPYLLGIKGILKRKSISNKGENETWYLKERKRKRGAINLLKE